MIKRFFGVRSVLTSLLILSIVFAVYSMKYKIDNWGFSLSPKVNTDVWTIEANVTFEPTGYPIKISIATPTTGKEFKVLAEDIAAPGYKHKFVTNGTRKAVLSSPAKEGMQDVYYRVVLYDNADTKGKEKASTPKTPQKPYFSAQTELLVKDILVLAAKKTGDKVQQIIKTLNDPEPNTSVISFLPAKQSQKELVESIASLLAVEGIPTRIVRGVKLEEGRKSISPDIMLEAYTEGRWVTYNIKDGKKGLPGSFVVFQRGGESLLDIEGGENSAVKFSVIKSVRTSLNLTSHRAKLVNDKTLFEYSIYNLPLLEQNTLKWLMIFPLAILIVVVMRNIVGIKTMGTFTPMLLAMALVKTGFVPGLLCFAVIVGIGLLIRALLSKLNLLLVPRISAVVIFVILMMQMMTIFGYKFSVETALSAAFFPIIIMAWIIERASITWEEDGPRNACEEIFYSLVVAIVTYFIICNEYIRHIMFAFNELNLVILFIVMLIGTYTGYRLTELKRFAPLARKDK